MIVWKARVVHGSEPVGMIVAGDHPALATSVGLLELLTVQPAGGRQMSGADFVRGRPDLIGLTLG